MLFISFPSYLTVNGQDCTCTVSGVAKASNSTALSINKEYQLLKPLLGLSSVKNGDSVLKGIFVTETKQGDSVSGIKWSGHIYSADKIVFKSKGGLLIDITPCAKKQGQFFEIPVKLNINNNKKVAPRKQTKTAWERFDYAVKVTELTWKNMLLRLAEVAPEKYPINKFFAYLNKKYKCDIPRVDKAGLRPDEYLDSVVNCLIRAKIDLPKEVYEQYLKDFAGADDSFNPVFERAYFCLTRQVDHAQESVATIANYDLRIKDENVTIGFATGLFRPKIKNKENSNTELKFLDVKTLKWNEITGLQLDNNNKVCFAGAIIGGTGISIAFNVAYPDLSNVNDEFWRIYKGQRLDEINKKETIDERNAFTGIYVPEAYMALPFAAKYLKVNAKQVLISYNKIQGRISIQAERADKNKIKLLLKDTSIISSIKEIQKELKKAGLHAEVYVDDPLRTGYFSNVIIRFDYQAKE